MPRKRASINRIHVVFVCLTLALILGSYLLVSPQSSNAPALAAREVALPNKDVNAGRIVVPERVACREFGFDNHSGQLTDKGGVACNEGHATDPSMQSLYRRPVNRLDSIRRAFAPR